MTVIWAVFALLLLLVGDLGDELLTPGTAARLLVLLIASYFLLRVWTTRVWVEAGPGPGEAWLVHARLGRSRAALLSPPNSLRVRAPDPFGPRPEWSIRVLTPDGPEVKVSAPWVTELPRLLSLLRPIIAEHPGLATDEEARNLFVPSRRRLD